MARQLLSASLHPEAMRPLLGAHALGTHLEPPPDVISLCRDFSAKRRRGRLRDEILALAIEALMDGARQGQPLVRIAACHGLSALVDGYLHQPPGPPLPPLPVGLADALRSAGTSDDPRLRAAAAAAAGKLGVRDAIEWLRPLLDDTTPEPVTSAAVSLGLLADHASSRRLILALESRWITVRVAAMQGLSALGDVSAVPAIERALEHDIGGDVAAAAIRALAVLHPSLVRPRLGALLQPEAPWMQRRAAMEACAILDASEHVPELEAFIRSVDAAHAVRALGGIGHADATAALRRLRGIVRRGSAEDQAILHALSSSSDPGALIVMIDLASQPLPDGSRTAAATLSSYPHHAPRALTLIDSPHRDVVLAGWAPFVDATVRARALQVLRQVGWEEHIAIRRAVTDGVLGAEAREVVLAALGPPPAWGPGEPDR